MPSWSNKYYVIERVGVEYHQRYVKDIGHMYLINDPWGEPGRDPTFGPYLSAFRWDTYQNAVHWLARWSLTGTHRVLWVG